MEFTIKIIEIAKEIFDDEEIKPETKLEDVNDFDSMNLAQLIIEIEKELDVTVDDEKISKELTFEQLSVIILEDNK